VGAGAPLPEGRFAGADHGVADRLARRDRLLILFCGSESAPRAPIPDHKTVSGARRRGGSRGWRPRAGCRGRSPSGGCGATGRRSLPAAPGGRTARDRRSRRPASCPVLPRSGSPRTASAAPSGFVLIGLAPARGHLGRAHGADGHRDVADDEAEAALGTLDPRRRAFGDRRVALARGTGGRHGARRRRSSRPGRSGTAPHHVDRTAHRAGETALTGDVELGSACAASDDHASVPPWSNSLGSTGSPTAPIESRYSASRRRTSATSSRSSFAPVIRAIWVWM